MKRKVGSTSPIRHEENCRTATLRQPYSVFKSIDTLCIDLTLKLPKFELANSPKKKKKLANSDQSKCIKLKPTVFQAFPFQTSRPN